MKGDLRKQIKFPEHITDALFKPDIFSNITVGQDQVGFDIEDLKVLVFVYLSYLCIKTHHHNY